MQLAVYRAQNAMQDPNAEASSDQTDRKDYAQQVNRPAWISMPML